MAFEDNVHEGRGRGPMKGKSLLKYLSMPWLLRIVATPILHVMSCVIDINKFRATFHDQKENT